jgi:hypothetical protein
MFRQGDVLIIPVAEMPGGAQCLEHRRSPVVLAEGEATGHAHAIRDGEVREYWWSGPKDGPSQWLIDVLEECTVTHEEHAPVPLRRGVYRIVRQREYVDPQARGATTEVTNGRPWTVRYVAD